MAVLLLEREFCVPEVLEFSLCLDEDDDFANKRISLKPKENGTSGVGCPGTNTVKKEEAKPQAKSKPPSPVKQTPTSALDFFGTRSVQRSEKKLVASKRKEVSTEEAPARGCGGSSEGAVGLQGAAECCSYLPLLCMSTHIGAELS